MWFRAFSFGNSSTNSLPPIFLGFQFLLLKASDIILSFQCFLHVGFTVLKHDILVVRDISSCFLIISSLSGMNICGLVFCFDCITITHVGLIGCIGFSSVFLLVVLSCFTFIFLRSCFCDYCVFFFGACTNVVLFVAFQLPVGNICLTLEFQGHSGVLWPCLSQQKHMKAGHSTI